MQVPMQSNQTNSPRIQPLLQRVEPAGRLSQAVSFNGFVFLTGQVGAPNGSATEQTKAVLNEIDRLLQAAGSHKSRILNANILLSDMGDFAEMNLVWDAWVDADNPPARSTFQAELTSPAYRVEIIVTAAML